MSASESLLKYRQFRDAMMDASAKKARKHPSVAYWPDTQSRGQQHRHDIVEYRSHLKWHGAALIADQPELESHVRRALRIPASVHWDVKPWLHLTQRLLALLPIALADRRLKRLLHQVGTYEGRAFVFEKMIDHTILGQCHYGESFDYACRVFTLPAEPRQFHDLVHADVDWLRAARRLGMLDGKAIAKWLPSHLNRAQGKVVLMLVEERILKEPEEVAWIAARSPRWHDHAHQDDQIDSARRVVQLLGRVGVERRQLATACVESAIFWRSDRLPENLALLHSAGIDNFSALFAEVGHYLWTSSLQKWNLLVYTFGLREPKDFIRFTRLLESDKEVGLPLVHALLNLVADAGQLALCQDIMLAAGGVEDGSRCIDALNILVSAPFLLSVEQIARADRYLCRDSNLQAFLAVLERHGYGTRASVMSFQKLFGTVSAASLDSLLTIAAPRTSDATADDVVAWLVVASKGGYFEEYAYLSSALHLTRLGQLHQTLKMASLGVQMLRYLVEEQGLDTLASLSGWYRKDAVGVHQMRHWGPITGLRKILIDDAFKRKSFHVVEGNQRCLDRFIDHQLERPPVAWRDLPDSEDARREYMAERERAKKAAEPALLAVLPDVLSATRGVLLEELLAGAMRSPADLNAYLSAFNPLIDQLLVGRGPDGAVLSEMDANAIALVYRTDPETVRNAWPRVIAKESHIAELAATVFPIAWKGVEYVRKAAADQRGLAALERAAAFAKQFCSHPHDMHRACKHLRTRQLGERAADVTTLARHLGILLGIAARDPAVSEWVERGFTALQCGEDDDASNHQQYDALQVLFNATLPDAVGVMASDFVGDLNEVEAGALAEKLGRAEEGVATHATLRTAISALMAQVLPYYQRWVKSEKSKLKPLGSASTITELQAIVSKHPAAFFAKAAAGICTAANVEMWEEKRHAHLLVFDPSRRLLAGMALVYIEVVPNIHPTRPSLIIRAMNPMIDMTGIHTPSSIVDAYLTVAVDIARTNQLAGVAFPPSAGMHLLSNQEDIEADIKTRWIGRAKPHVGRARDQTDVDVLLKNPLIVDAQFDAYEKGENRQGKLYLIWRAAASAFPGMGAPDASRGDTSPSELMPIESRPVRVQQSNAGRAR